MAQYKTGFLIVKNLTKSMNVTFALPAMKILPGLKTQAKKTT
jgi:hypothetical protein